MSTKNGSSDICWQLPVCLCSNAFSLLSQKQESSVMVSLAEREHAEKRRSAVAASKKLPQLVPQELARLRTPAEETAFPLEYAFHLLGDVKGKTVLEYGCGDGRYTVILAERGAKVIAFDISAPLLALAKDRIEITGCEEVEFVLGSAHALPLPDESVDVVFGMAILHHLDLESASREVQRVLRKGGRGIFKEPLRNSKLLAWLRQFFPQHGDVSPFERPLTDREIKDFVMPYQHRARTFQLPLSRIAHILPFVNGPAKEFCAQVDSYLLQRFPSLVYYGAVKVFEMVKEEPQR
jgi:ubiquinone/menaquinone biosynthesis C-methylase UbiE